MDTKIIAGCVMGALVVSGVSFWGGMKYSTIVQASERAAFPGGGQGGNRGQFRNSQGSGARGGFAGGEIINIDEKSLTVKAQDGNTRTIYLSASTTVSKSTGGSREDIKTGEQVVVTGTPNQDGSLTAVSVQLGQAFRERPQTP